ncbi:Cys/Met metabolism PLP-dependent enzyme-domain-containing protein [Suillus occidentalis]|nr:Cys/Met metabolism PLP-dependent enzyme-domain-containing protein [Suillus occidentalis]
MGIESTFVDLENTADGDVLGAIKENTKLIWIESPTNPTLRLIDIPRIVALTRQAPSKPLVLVDNIFLSPFYASPLLQGADIVIHSLTKYINGHSDVVMGAAILSSSSTPDRDYDSLAQKLRFLQNAHGAVLSAFNYWLAQRGAKTLAVRMKTHGLNVPLDPHTQQFLNIFPQSTLAHCIPYGGIVSFRAPAETEAVHACREFGWCGESCGVTCTDDACEYPAYPYVPSILSSTRTKVRVQIILFVLCRYPRHNFPFPTPSRLLSGPPPFTTTSGHLDTLCTRSDTVNDLPAKKSSCPRLSLSHYTYLLPAPFNSLPGSLSPTLCANLFPGRSIGRRRTCDPYLLPTPINLLPASLGPKLCANLLPSRTALPCNLASCLRPLSTINPVGILAAA